MLKEQPIRPMCSECNRLPARTNGKSAKGFQRWHKYCNSCASNLSRGIKKDLICSKCGFECEDSCQMCYIDGVTICQNCNALRLKDIRPHSELTVDATVDWRDIRL